MKAAGTTYFCGYPLPAAAFSVIFILYKFVRFQDKNSVCRGYSRMKAPKQQFLRFCAFFLSVLTVFSLSVPALSEEVGEDCPIWSFNPETFCFTVEDIGFSCPDDVTLLCTAALYQEDGRMLSVGMAQRAADGTVTLSCSPCQLPGNYCIRFFFADTSHRPLAPAVSYRVTTTAPTCTLSGSVTAMAEDGSHGQTIATLPATGHSFSDPVVEEPANAVDCGWSTRSCRVCPYTETTPIYPDSSIARLCMYGDLTGIGKKAEVPITVSFEGEGKDFDCYALLKYQGHTSLIYDKKNYTLKMFTNEERTKKNKMTFYDWNKEHKYILKANYIDPSVSRNLVCADIWSEMAACREDHHPRLEDCSNYGATAGFPIALYLNDEFQGLYTFTLHRDDDLFDMEDDQKDGILVTNTAQTDAAYFKAPATFDSNSDWEVEFSGMEDTSWVEDKLNALIGFVMTASDEEFRTELGRYLDVNSALDYLLAIYSLGLTNSGAKNITMATYEDRLLFFSLCDMENAFGLSATGNEAYSPDQYLPVCTNGVWDSTTQSLLWDRILNLYYPELCARYAQLRREILTEENILGKVTQFLAPISEEYYAADRALHPDMPQLQQPHAEQITSYVTRRLPLLDDLFLLRESG